MRGVVVLGTIGILVFAVAGCSGSKAGPSGPQAMPVQMQEIKLQPVEDYTEYLAAVRSRGSSVLQPEVEGQITKILVHSGQKVAAGTPLLVIDPRKQQATVNTEEATQRSKRATLEWNRQQLERAKNLYAAGVISKQELDQAQTAFDAAQADLEASTASVRQQQVQLHYYEVKAPTAGTVGDIPVRVGDRVTNTTVLTTLDTGGGLEAYISVPAEMADRARLGMQVDVLDDSGKPELRVPVTFVSPRIDAQNQLLLIKAAIPADKQNDFRNEQLVHVRVIWKTSQQPVVPLTAISRLGAQTFVFVAAQQGGNTVAQQRAVQLGDLVGNSYPVLSGLKPGEKVIVSGVQLLIDGMPVAPMG